jgi:hypothetical protein
MAKTITLPHNWTPRPYQQKLWRYLEGGGKRAIEIAHRRWGKDDIALHWAAVAAMQRPASYWHMLPNYSLSTTGAARLVETPAPRHEKRTVRRRPNKEYRTREHLTEAEVEGLSSYGLNYEI